MKNKSSRRNFFKVLLGSSAAAAFINSNSSPADTEKPKKLSQLSGKQSGYHETQHIRNYYNKINF